MLNAELNSSANSYILMNLFFDAMSKIGKQKKIKNIEYTVNHGLVVTDVNDVVWLREVNAKVKFPEELNDKPNSRIADDDAQTFCSNCDFGVKDNPKLLCSVCEYLEKA